MDFFLDIKLVPDAEMPLNRLLNTAYTKFHKALYDLSSNSIGISFPNYRLTLGNILRVHGNRRDLEALQQLNWLGGLIGYCSVNDIQPIPDNVQFRTVGRKQPTMNPSSLRRLIKRGSIMEENVKSYRAKMFSKGLNNPYVEIASGSNEHRHRRYIEYGILLDKPIIGCFDQFGLSKTATIPWWE